MNWCRIMCKRTVQVRELNMQENCSSQRVEYAREALDGNLEHILKNDEDEQRFVLNHEEKLGLTEQKQSFISVQESTTRVPIAA